jgi:hypothetical protein
VSGYRPRVLSKEAWGVYFGRGNTPRIRATYANTAAAEGDRSLSDFVEKAVMAEVARREGKHNGGLPTPDVAIFADTGWEPAAVYTHLARLTAAVSFPVLRVSVGNLRDDALDPERRYASVPYFVRNPDGTDGMGRRQCTSEYKLNPIRRKVRELLGAAGPEFRTVPGGRVAEQWVGFSTDEVGRVNAARDSDGVRYLTTRYPLLELGMSRTDCQRWLRARGWGATASGAHFMGTRGGGICGTPAGVGITGGITTTSVSRSPRRVAGRPVPSATTPTGGPRARAPGSAHPSGPMRWPSTPRSARAVRGESRSTGRRSCTAPGCRWTWRRSTG